MSTAEPTGLRRLASELTPTAIVCLAVIALAAFIAIFAPVIAPYDEGTILTNESFASPGNGMLLGSDYLGRDIASRLGFGIRTTLSVALSISVIAFLIGSALGFFAAIMGGWTDTLVSRTVDALISFPAIMIALIVVSSLGSSFLVLIVTVAIIDSTRVFRVARALGMDIVVQDYIEAARVRGEGIWWIIWHELLPNALGPLAAEFGIRFTYAILFVSALSFLGLGVQPPHSDLGLMVKENMQGLLYGSFSPLYPALAIAMVTVSTNILVDCYLKSTGANLPEEL
ncbi:MAG: ABC transporter permease [Anderseniella sp.]